MGMLVQSLAKDHCCWVLSPGKLAFCTAAVILDQRSFLQDLVLLRDDRRFWNSFCPEAVHMNAYKHKNKSEHGWCRASLLYYLPSWREE